MALFGMNDESNIIYTEVIDKKINNNQINYKCEITVDEYLVLKKYLSDIIKLSKKAEKDFSKVEDLEKYSEENQANIEQIIWKKDIEKYRKLLGEYFFDKYTMGFVVDCNSVVSKKEQSAVTRLSQKRKKR